MKIARLCFAMIFAILLGGADDPNARTVIVLAKPVKVLKIIGFPGEEEDMHTGVLFLVKMRTISVVRGTFPKRTFKVVIMSHMAEYILKEKEYIAVFDSVDGKYKSLGTAINDVQRACFDEELLKKTDIPPEALVHIVQPPYPETRCYLLP